MVMETPHISYADLSCAFLSWPLFNPALMLGCRWDRGGREEARKGRVCILPTPCTPTHPRPRNRHHLQEATCAVTLKKLPPKITSHILGPPEAEAMVKTSAHHHPALSIFLLTDDALSSEHPFCRWLGLSHGPADTEGSEECQATLRLEGRAAGL